MTGVGAPRCDCSTALSLRHCFCHCGTALSLRATTRNPVAAWHWIPDRVRDDKWLARDDKLLASDDKWLARDDKLLASDDKLLAPDDIVIADHDPQSSGGVALDPGSSPG